MSTILAIQIVRRHSERSSRNPLPSDLHANRPIGLGTEPHPLFRRRVRWLVDSPACIGRALRRRAIRPHIRCRPAHRPPFRTLCSVCIPSPRPHDVPAAIPSTDDPQRMDRRWPYFAAGCKRFLLAIDIGGRRAAARWGNCPGRSVGRAGRSANVGTRALCPDTFRQCGPCKRARSKCRRSECKPA